MRDGRPLLGQLLVEAGALTEPDLDRALQVAAREGTRLGAALTSMRLCTKTQIARAMAQQMGLPFVDLRETPPAVDALRLVPAETARQLRAAPVRLEHLANGTTRLVVVALNPMDFRVDDLLHRLTGSAIQVTAGVEAQIEAVLLQYPQLASFRPQPLLLEEERPHASAIEGLIRNRLSRPEAPVPAPPVISAAPPPALKPLDEDAKSGSRLLTVEDLEALVHFYLSEGQEVALEISPAGAVLFVSVDGVQTPVGTLPVPRINLTLAAGTYPEGIRIRKPGLGKRTL